MKQLLPALLFFLVALRVAAQWTPAPSPATYAIASAAFGGDTVVVSTYEPSPKFYLSNHAGQIWTDISDPAFALFYPVKVVGGKIFALERTAGVAVYANGQWELRNTGLQTYPGQGYALSSLDAANGRLLASSVKNDLSWLYLSVDDGLHWTPVGPSGLQAGFESVVGTFAGTRIYVQGINFSAGSKPQAYYSDDYGQSWKQLPVGGAPGQYTSLYFNENRNIVLVKGLTGKYLHQGDSLVEAAGLPTGGQVYWLVEAGNRLFVKIDQTSWVSADGGLHWSAAPQIPDFYDLKPYGALLVGTTSQNDMLASADNGLTWAPFGLTNVLTSTFGGYLTVSNNQLFFTTVGKDGFYRFDPVANDWEARNNGVDKTSAYCIQISADGPKAWVYSWLGAFYSPDAGQTWQPLSVGIWGFEKIGSQYFAIDSYLGLIRSDNGVDWLPTTAQPANLTKIFGHDDKLYMATYDAVLLVSADAGASWDTVSTTMPVAANVTFDTTHWYVTGYDDDVYASTDQGQTWSIIGNFNLPGPLLVHEGRLLTGLYSGGIRYSDNQGQTWKSSLGTGLKFQYDGNGLLAVGSTLVATGQAGAVRVSVNNGGLWTNFNGGLNTAINCTETTVFGDWLYTACDNGLWRRPLAELPGVNAVTEPLTDLYPPAPNPTTGWFTLGNTASGLRLDVVVSNVHGQPVLQTACPGSDCRLDLSAQPAGLYLLQVFDGDRWSVSRLIKR